MLALGRSSYDVLEPVSAILSPFWRPLSVRAAETNAPVQEYDSRGYPTNTRAKLREKDLRRAKNDILSTMGIVASSRTHNADTSNTWRKNKALLVLENESGLYVTIISNILSTVTGWWLHAIDQRLQMSDAYDHTSLLDMLDKDYRSMGAWGFYFAGLPTWLMYRTVKAAYICVSEKFLAKIGQIHYSSMQGRGWVKCCQYLTSGLLFGYYLAVFPLNLAVQRAVNYTGLVFISFAQPFLKSQVHQILLSALPGPDHPDRLSIEVAKENDLTELRIDKSEDQNGPMAVARARILSFGEDLKEFMNGKIMDSFQYYIYILTHGFSAVHELCIQRPVMGLSWIANRACEGAQAQPAEADELHTTRLNLSGRETIPLESSDGHDNSMNETLTQLHDVRLPPSAGGSRFSEALQFPQDLSTLANGTTAPRDTLNDTHSQLINQPTAEEVGLNTEEVSVIPHDNRSPSEAVSPSGSQTGEGVTFATYTGTAVVSHRVSLLSVGPADFMSSLLSSAIAANFARPLNSYWVRSTVQSYIRSSAGRATAELQISKVQLRPLTAWCGGGSSDDRLSYASKVVIISGVQILSDIVIWKLGTAFTVFLGIRKFTWGNI
ncbi:hypothetical protein KEM54_005009 [Ascosphaera aggregata]|nr:hypothetical protein KEM54_005009 [Ascosphaera aggregata]